MHCNIRRPGIGPENPEAQRRRRPPAGRPFRRVRYSGTGIRQTLVPFRLFPGRKVPVGLPAAVNAFPSPFTQFGAPFFKSRSHAPPRGAKRRRGRNLHQAPPPSCSAPGGEIISRPGQRPSQKTSKSTSRSSSSSDENAASAASEYGRDAGCWCSYAPWNSYAPQSWMLLTGR